MKLRFRENSLRLRVNRREVKELAAGNALQEEIRFPGDTRMAYILEPGREQAFTASFSGGTIRVSAPQVEVEHWAESETIGLYTELPANGSLLRIAIEKDLECMDGPEEERDPEAYPRAVETTRC